ncbi:Isochorismatase-like protein [Limtongia smithiae]|uniref:Isochorismatase-like protein n=1 Tax=Limtongia smithiae TaxID=1125753 RepID=UPI0034CD1EF3
MELLPWTDEKRTLVASTIRDEFSPEQSPNFQAYFTAALAVTDFQSAKGRWPESSDLQDVLALINTKDAPQPQVYNFVNQFCTGGFAAAPETIAIMARIVSLDAIKLLTGMGHPINNTSLEDVVRVVVKAYPTLTSKIEAKPNGPIPHILDALNPCSPLSVSAHGTALLLLDFHKFIIASQPGEGKKTLATAMSLREWAKSQGIFVVHCMIDLKAYTEPNRKMVKFFNGARERMGNAPELSGEPDCIAAIADEYVFWRPPSHVSALGSYGLESFLSAHKIQSLIIAGFSSSGCVINTVKGAADKGFIVTVVENACGDKSPDVHSVIMQKLLVGQAHVVEKDTLVDAWANSVVTLTDKLSI